MYISKDNKVPLLILTLRNLRQVEAVAKSELSLPFVMPEIYHEQFEQKIGTPTRFLESYDVSHLVVTLSIRKYMKNEYISKGF